MNRDEYPQTVIEILRPQMRFAPAGLKAVGSFAASGPWSGSLTEREVKFRRLNRDLSVAYGIAEPQLGFANIDGSSSITSRYIPAVHRIVLVGKLSVVTYLHEFAHARGMGERAACRWSINLFRRCFPRQYAKLAHEGHTLVRRTGNGSRAFRENPA